MHILFDYNRLPVGIMVSMKFFLMCKSRESVVDNARPTPKRNNGDIYNVTMNATCIITSSPGGVTIVIVPVLVNGYDVH